MTLCWCLCNRLELHRHAQNTNHVCYLCCEPEDDRKPLHIVQYFWVDYNFKTIVCLLNDRLLHFNLHYGDLKANDAKFHCDCLRQLYTKVSNAQL